MVWLHLLRVTQQYCLAYMAAASTLQNLTPDSFPSPTEGRSSPTNTPVFPPVPLSYQVLHGSVSSFPLFKYSCLLSAGILHALLCEGIFLMYLWREMYSMSTYSPTILFSAISFFLKWKQYSMYVYTIF